MKFDRELWAQEYATRTKLNQQHWIRPGPCLAVDDRTGLILREAPEGGVFAQERLNPASCILKVDQRAGALAAEMLVQFEGDGVARIREITGPGGPNALGIRRMRTIWRLLAQVVPDVKTFTGHRISGARCRDGTPVAVTWSLQRLGGRAS